MRRKSEKGFSLMEMMVVLLIMSIIMAASAPIVSRKMSKSSGASSASPWIFVGNTGDIAYNWGGKKVSAIIGATSIPSSAGNPRLYIDCGDNSDAQITFGHGNQVAKVIADPVNWKVGISNATIPEQSVAFGGGQAVSGTNVVAIGNSVSVSQTGTTAVGSFSKATGSSSVAIGYNSTASEVSTVAIGIAEAKGQRSIAIGQAASAGGRNAIAIGYSSQANQSSNNTGGALAIGDDVLASAPCSIALGTKVDNNGSNASTTKATATGATAIGGGTKASGKYSIAMGFRSEAAGEMSQAIARESLASAKRAVAIGIWAKARHENSVAIGYNATTNYANEIVLGDTSATVYIPGNLVVRGHVLLNTGGGSDGTGYQTGLHYRNKSHLSCAMSDGKDNAKTSQALDQNGSGDGLYRLYRQYSDRRLKNVGEKYTAGLDELKKLELYHYTYKKDETKTPHVGVIAQDLQKVFPNAISKDADGYLMIRLEDMFYAVVNAVRELDTKITSILEDISGMKSKIEAQDKIITEFQSQVITLQQTIDSQNERISALEKMIQEKK